MLETTILTTNFVDERLVLFSIFFFFFLSFSVHIVFTDNICNNQRAIDHQADSKCRVHRVLQAPVCVIKSCGKSGLFVENKGSLLLDEKSAHAIGHLKVTW